MDNIQFQTPPQTVTIQTEPALLAALVDIRNTLGLLVAEVQNANRQAAEYYALHSQQIAAQLQWDQTTSAIAAAIAPQEAPQQPDVVPMTQTTYTDPTGAVGAITGLPDPSTDVPPQTDPIPVGYAPQPASADPPVDPQNAAPAVVSPAEAYAAIQDQWFLDEAANPMVRNPDGTSRTLNAAEMAGWSQQMNKSKKGRR